MPYVSKKVTKTTAFKPAGKVELWANENPLKWKEIEKAQDNQGESEPTNGFAHIDNVGKQAQETQRLFFTNFGFKNEIPSDATIERIEVRVAHQVTDSAYNKESEVTGSVILTTQDYKTYWGNEKKLTIKNTDGIQDHGSKSDAWGSAIAGKSDSWGAGDVRASHVNRDGFGCSISYTSKAYSEAKSYQIRVFYVYIRVTYSYNEVSLVEGQYNISANNVSCLADKKVVNVPVTIHNTNDVADSPLVSATIQNKTIATFSNNTTSYLEYIDVATGGTVTKNFSIIGLKEGSTTLTISPTGQGNPKTVNITVNPVKINSENQSVGANYSATITASKNQLSQNETTTLTVKIQNTNNTAGTVNTQKLTVNNTNLRFIEGTTEKASVTISSFSLDANQSKTFTFTLKAKNDGASTVTFNQSTQFPASVLKFSIVTKPSYSVILKADKSTLDFGEVTTLWLKISNMNNVASKVDAQTITSTNKRIKFIDNNVESDKYVVPAFTLNANSTKTVKIQVRGISQGTDKINLLASSQLPKTSFDVKVNPKVNTLNQSIASNTNGFYVDFDNKLNLVLSQANTNTQTISQITLKFDDATIMTFIDGTSTKTNTNTYNFSKKSEVIEIPFDVIGKKAGTTSYQLTIVSTEGTEYYTGKITVQAKATFNKPIFEVTPTTFIDGQICNLKVTYKNNSNRWGYSPQFDYTLPLTNMVNADNNTKKLIANSESVAPNGEAVYLFRVKISGIGSYNWNVNYGGTSKTFKITVQSPPPTAPVFDTDWISLSRTSMYGNETAILKINYKITNEFYPTTVKETVIQLPSQLEFTDGTQKKTIPKKTLNSGQTYTESLTIRVKGSNRGKGVINVTNKDLGTKLYNFEVLPYPARISCIATMDNSPITLNADPNIPNTTYVQLRYSNTGEVIGLVDNHNIRLSGGCLTFEDGSTNQTLAGLQLKPGEVKIINIIIYAVATGTGTIAFNCPSASASETWSQVVYERPKAEFEYGFTLFPSEIRISNQSGTFYTELSATIHHIAGTNGVFNDITIMLGDGLLFENETQSYTITGEQMSIGETKTIKIPQRIYAETVGNIPITVTIDDEDDSNSSEILLKVLAPELQNIGVFNIENCRFSNNHGSEGGAIKNDSGVLNYLDCIFTGNTASSSCENVNDNGVCKQ